ncbi:hypothetical protein LTR09_008496 [Extremus antarcticus]|uniref:Uncharacterized protein n=1 Tax=Extremus antarcticus TaxID=702011 RepID=A0AAJ0G698_9PEZI|nr:hypothetical protein LTR09_008496 [Extremus antarcticus]
MAQNSYWSIWVPVAGCLMVAPAGGWPDDDFRKGKVWGGPKKLMYPAMEGDSDSEEDDDDHEGVESEDDDSEQDESVGSEIEEGELDDLWEDMRIDSDVEGGDESRDDGEEDDVPAQDHISSDEDGQPPRKKPRKALKSLGR